ncbi:sodium-dependent proline transporter-like [Macrobrachium rosenbergii]|uniref:sodium-dependent proline transporter-like n=1 Tax=Macrobrachium rosenbergii TaxID=79674 RepID=UPI0034D4CF9C
MPCSGETPSSLAQNEEEKQDLSELEETRVEPELVELGKNDNEEDRKEGEEEEKNKKRELWTTKWDYLFSLIGLTIGLGNVWRFPFVCYKNGGGAFLIPYLSMLVMVGIPVYMLETATGQFSSSGCLTIYSVCPMFKGVGYSCSILNYIFMMMYSIVITYPILFMWHSLSAEVPWTHCNNTWNTANCTLASSRNFSDEEEGATGLLSPADEFFHRNILEMSESVTVLGGFQWPLVTAATLFWIMTFLCVFKGIKVLGKLMWFTATFPYVILVILLIRGVTLPGAWNGIYYYLSPDLSKLLELKVWAAAAAQIFYSLGPGYGVLITLGSYNKFSNKCIKDAINIPILNCLTSIFAGFVVFAVLGFMAHRAGTTVDKVTAAGPSLAFIIYPEALSLMPAAPVWSFLFFLTLFFVGSDSIFVHVETAVLVITDELPQYRPKRGLITACVCLVSLAGTLLFCTRGGIYWLTLVDQFCASYTIILNCLCELIVFGIIYGAGRTVRDLQMMTKTSISYIWYFAWLVISPLVLIVISTNLFFGNVQASYRGEIFPTWVQVIGWFTAIVSMQAIPSYVIYYLSRASGGGSLRKKFKKGVCPASNWGPAQEENKTAWRQYRLENPLRSRILHPGILRGN